ncbi:MAG: polyphosphate kinase 1 [Chloroflexi bacterium]|nr:polyphosphate kinase 1 [Chloroflexota bacterium]
MTTERYPPSCYINRELSWIEFNERVLREAADPTHPLLERAKFLAIFATNLDEFFMIRVSGLKKQIEAEVVDVTPDGNTPNATLDHIVAKLTPLLVEHSRVWNDEVKPLLCSHGVCVLGYDELNEEQRTRAIRYFDSEVFPVLTPLAFDPGHPFPHISNLSLNLAVVVLDEKGRERFARVKVPPSLPRLVPLTDCPDDECGHCFVWLDQVIAANIAALFPGMAVQRTYAFRVTRDTDIEIQEDEAGDLLSTIERVMQDRRFGSVVRLEIAHDMPDRVRDILIQNLEIDLRDVYRVDGTLSLSSLTELLRLPLPKLKDPPFTPHPPFVLADNGEDVFSLVRQGDILLHHPYDAFSPVVDFISAAARDPQVLTIKVTLYRVGANSPIVQALIEAIQNGKQVAVLVELKARFDEENNIQWARALEDEGVHVVYGLPGLKVHCKVALVVRREHDRIRRYVHLSTGNYNATTARIYTDLGIFTCRDDIGEDASDLFNLLTGYSRQREFRQLYVAPVNLRKRLIDLIEREIELHKQYGGGHLIFKMNSLVDPAMINVLYCASQVGIKVDLIARGICCLRPGMSGISDNIRVISIVGRFLEHSRVYYFRNNGDEELFVGSADLMPRNLDRRVETVFPILDADLRNRVRDEVLLLQLRDNVKARELNSDGSYCPVASWPGEPRINSQEELLRRAGQMGYLSYLPL